MKIYSPAKQVFLSEFGYLEPAREEFGMLAPTPETWHATQGFSDGFDWSRPKEHLKAPAFSNFKTGLVTCRNIFASAERPSGNAYRQDKLARRIVFFSRGYLKSSRPTALRNDERLPFDRFLSNLLTACLIKIKSFFFIVKKIEGRTLFLGGKTPDSANFYHFWTDCICDMHLLREFGLNLNDFDHIFMAWQGHSWQKMIAQICGIPVERILPFHTSECFHFSELVAIQRVQNDSVSAAWCVDGIRQQAKWVPPAKIGQRRRIFVTRGIKARRPVLNEPALVKIAGEYGYEAVDCGKLTVSEQQELFASASAIIGPHGAGFTNIAWCQPKTVFLEFVNPNWTAPCFYDMAQQADLIYMNVSTQPVRGRGIWTESVLDEGKFRAALNWVETQL